ncbi:MAG: radical SAM protein [Anaerolineae bacterium]|jgi:anaerobic magnesium-protoporphyrin IX monomethyl ester cyclase
MADVLLVNPLFLYEDPVESELMTPYLPLGVLYLAAVARDAGYHVAVFDAMFAEGDQAFVAALETERPRVVGFSVLATVRQAALRLATLAKQHASSGESPTVIVGGADPTARPERYLLHEKNGTHPIDLVVVGEGEETLLEILPPLLAMSDAPIGDRESLIGALNGVRGLAFRGPETSLVATEPRPLIEDVDRLPIPAREFLDVDRYRQAWLSKHDHFSLSLIATRGCPYGCKWCQKSVFGRSFRPRSADSVAAEMAQIKQHFRPDQVRVVDDVMGIDRDWVREWHDALIEKDGVIPFECLSRVDLLDEEMAGHLRDIECRRIHFGAESGSQAVLDAMNKGITVEQIRSAARLCRQLGIETYFYMMVGYPGESWSDLKRSVTLLRQTRPDAFSTTIAYPLPGTPFHEDVRDRLVCDDQTVPDWIHTAENRLLFQRGRYSTFFYRRVIRWFHSEWRDARLGAQDATPTLDWLLAKLSLWRDRLLVHAYARLPGLSRSRFRPALEP